MFFCAIFCLFRILLLIFEENQCFLKSFIVTMNELDRLSLRFFVVFRSIFAFFDSFWALRWFLVDFCDFQLSFYDYLVIF